MPAYRQREKVMNGLSVRPAAKTEAKNANVPSTVLELDVDHRTRPQRRPTIEANASPIPRASTPYTLSMSRELSSHSAEAQPVRR